MILAVYKFDPQIIQPTHNIITNLFYVGLSYSKTESYDLIINNHRNTRNHDTNLQE